jgi:MEDS: MEthanogen/methylotroph, DcmR Sensory domain
VVDTSEPEELLDALGTGGGAAHRADQLTVLASRDVYLTDRGFDMDGMLDFYGAELRSVAEGRSGYDCIRTAGEMTWALRDIPGVEDLLAYEARVNQVMAANPEAAAISLCLYDVERFDAELIVGVLRTHPKAVIAGTVIDNPFTSSRRSSCDSGTTDPTYATPLGFRERHQPPDPARSHAGTNGDDFPRLGLTSARKRGEAGWSVIGSSGLRVAAECAGCPLG